MWLQNVWGLSWDPESLGDTAAGAWAARKSHCVNSATLRGQSHSSLSKFKKGLSPTSQGEKCQRILWSLEKNGRVPKSSLRHVMYEELQGGAWAKPALSEGGTARPLKALWSWGIVWVLFPEQ